jgi:hypothetical protein
MIERAIVSLVITVSLWLWGCSASLTLGTTPVTNTEYYSTNPRTDSEALPTPQFIVVDANIDQGRITAIRLRHDPTQKARQEQDGQLSSMRTGQSSARQNARGESDRVIDAINAAFKRAQTTQEAQQREPHLHAPRSDQQTRLARQAGPIIGARTSRVYRWYNCPTYTKTVLHQQAQFGSWQEAEAAGYRTAWDCLYMQRIVYTVPGDE